MRVMNIKTKDWLCQNWFLFVVLPKGFNMWALQILALPSLRLKLLESPKNYNTDIVSFQNKCRSMGECNSYAFNCDYSLHTPTKQIFSSYFEMC